MIRRPPRSTLFPTRRSSDLQWADGRLVVDRALHIRDASVEAYGATSKTQGARADLLAVDDLDDDDTAQDRKSTRLNSSHGYISYAVFCLKKKKKINQQQSTA